MRAFIVVCLVALTTADQLGYNYRPVDQSYTPGGVSGVVSFGGAPNLGPAFISASSGPIFAVEGIAPGFNPAFGVGANAGPSFAGQGAISFGGPSFAAIRSEPAVVSGGDASNAAPSLSAVNSGPAVAAVGDSSADAPSVAGASSGSSFAATGDGSSVGGASITTVDAAPALTAGSSLDASSSSGPSLAGISSGPSLAAISSGPSLAAISSGPSLAAISSGPSLAASSSGPSLAAISSGPSAPSLDATGTGNGNGADFGVSQDGLSAASNEAPLANGGFEKEFYTFTADEKDFTEPDASNQIANTLKQGLRVVFIKAPENSGLENAALALAKHAAGQKTDIYVLSKQADIADLANKLNNENKNVNNKPEVHFVKYRTQEDATHAQHVIQAEYDALGGPSQHFDGGVASALNFASQAPVMVRSGTGGVAAVGNVGTMYLPASVLRLFRL